MFYFLLFLALLSTSSARAEGIKLSIGECANLFSALQSLDGHEQLTKDESRAVKVPYVLSGVTRMIIARDEAKLREIIVEFQQVQIGLREQLKGDEAGINAQVREVLEQKKEVELGRLKISVLGLDVNPIPPSVLSNLAAILDDDSVGGLVNVK